MGDLMTLPEEDWDPTQQDWDTYRDTLTARLKALANDGSTILPLAQYEELWPLWMWKRAVERRDQFVTEFRPHLAVWCRMTLSNASVPLDGDSAFNAYCTYLFLRWQWCYLQLIVVTAGMPQPQRRRIRLCDLSIAQQRAIRIPVGEDLPPPTPRQA